MIVGSSFWLFSVAKEHKKAVYGAAWLAGSGSSIILVTSLAKTAELVGTDKVRATGILKIKQQYLFDYY